jgi:hypothetical protein
MSSNIRFEETVEKATKIVNMENQENKGKRRIYAKELRVKLKYTTT